MEMEERKMPVLMGILNVTPDSFYDGGKHYSLDSAVRHAEKLILDGADIIDIGGESTRPGSTPVSASEELKRTTEVVKRVCALGALVSIDTTKPEVARDALSLGASIINDVSGRVNPEMAALAKEYGARLVITHAPADIDEEINIVNDVLEFFEMALSDLSYLGFPPENIIFDPGIGFGKTTEQNFDVLRNLYELKTLKIPILLGASNKSYIKNTIGADEQSLNIGNTITIAAALRDEIDMIRVHDVSHAKKVFKMCAKLDI
ncbi:MAG: dihydropteroate synthase [Clostridia bacterium]|nr:dihydropteroate synthase [Clostridia bacterium]